jgi:hypothetical protein
VAQYPLSDRTISEIILLSEIAKANSDHISIQDISILTSAGLDEVEIRTAWENTSDLRSSYELKQDLVVHRSEVIQDSITSAVLEKRSRARQFIQSARCFERFFRAGDPIVLSVSGSTSYYSTLPGDDLDFFTITNDGSLWIFLFKSMILARIYRLIHPTSPRLCFSCAIDDRFARKSFATDDLLLARDALNVIVLQGENYYHALLKQSSWMANYFPRLYRLRTEPSREEVRKPRVRSPFLRFLNLFLYFTMGRYLRFKSALLNWNLRGRALTGSLFILRSGPDHFIFESVRYRRLRQMYDKLGRTIRADASTVNIGT